MGKQLRFEENNLSIAHDVFRIAFPAFINTVLIASATSIDLMMVGKMGDFAISAVGLCKQPFLLLQIALTAFMAGIPAIIANLLGAGEEEKANQTLKQGLVIALIIATIISIFGYFAASPLVALMGGNADTQVPATTYFQILMFGLVPMALSHCIMDALRGCGDTAPLIYISVFSNLVNIGTNWLLIYGNLGFPELGIVGAGIATSLSYLASAAVAFSLVLGRKRKLHLAFNEKFHLQKNIIKELLQLGVPVAGNRASTRIGMLIMARLASSFSTEIFSAYLICFDLHNMAYWLSESVSSATTSLVGQSIGMKKPSLAKKYIKFTSLFGGLYPVLTGAALLSFGSFLIGLYTKSEITMVAGLSVLPIIVFFQPFQCACSVISGALMGMKKPKYAAIAVSLGIVIIRPIVAFLLTIVFPIGFAGIWIAIGADEIFRFFYVSRGLKIENKKVLVV